MQVETAASGFDQPELKPNGRTFSMHLGLNKRLAEINRESIYLNSHRIRLSEAVEIFGFGVKKLEATKSLDIILKTAVRSDMFNSQLREHETGWYFLDRDQLLLLWTIVEVKAQEVTWFNAPYVVRYVLEDNRLINELGRPKQQYVEKGKLQPKQLRFIRNFRELAGRLLLPEGDLGSLSEREIRANIPEDFVVPAEYEFTKRRDLDKAQLLEMRELASLFAQSKPVDSVSGAVIFSTNADYNLADFDSAVKVWTRLQGMNSTSVEITHFTNTELFGIMAELVQSVNSISAEEVKVVVTEDELRSQ